jgi:hypothetical protein
MHGESLNLMADGGTHIYAGQQEVLAQEVKKLREENVRMNGGSGRSDRPRVPVEHPDHMNVPTAINVVACDARQLMEEIGELRARLSPVLADYDLKHQGRAEAPVRSKMAADLYDVLALVQNCRQAVELTLMQLDL